MPISKIQFALLSLLLLLFALAPGRASGQEVPKPPKPVRVPGTIQAAPMGSPASAENPNRSLKPVPPSPSNPVGKKTPAKLYAASSEETADSILADSLSQTFHQGDEHFHEGEWNHTLNLYKIVEQGDPHNLDAYSNSAFMLWSMTRNDEAVDALKAGIKANPNTYYMYDELGTHYLLHMKDPIAALPYFEQAVRYPGPRFFTWQNLGRCYEKANEWDKAVEAWRKATLFPDAPRAEANLKRVIAERDKRKNQ